VVIIGPSYLLREARDVQEARTFVTIIILPRVDFAKRPCARNPFFDAL